MGPSAYWNAREIATENARSKTLLFLPDVAEGATDDGLSFPHHAPHNDAVALQKHQLTPAAIAVTTPDI